MRPKPFTALLIGVTCVTGGIFAASAVIVAASSASVPTSPPDGPNIGIGLLNFAGLMNVPTIVGWAGWLAWKAARL